MFGSKPKATPTPASQNEPVAAEVDPEFEYCTFASFGIEGWNKEATRLSRQGWELVNGCMAGTANYGYMRRRISRP